VTGSLRGFIVFLSGSMALARPQGLVRVTEEKALAARKDPSDN